VIDRALFDTNKEFPDFFIPAVRKWGEFTEDKASLEKFY
jgi:hypothetical protein